jgi:hypothetical protein
VITWQAPVGSVPIVSYRIYRDADLQNLIGEVPNIPPLVFTDPNRKPCKKYKYYVVSVDQFGNLSVPALVKIKRKH